ncbi:MAG: hypothetical protein DWC07_06900 [Candidatus Poseidoniales archaeon]|nr:MAG: hypothetical protein DWC07_06900 [Candidatus Poseidoniales archaeon]
MTIGPRRLFALAFSAMGVAVAVRSIQQSEWMLTLAASSLTMGFVFLLWMSSSSPVTSKARHPTAIEQGLGQAGRVDAVASDLPDPLEHGFDMPL